MPVEIERRYLLRAAPEFPADVVKLRIEQGYLDPADPTTDIAEAQRTLSCGRVRRTTQPDGTVVCTHTIKRGLGLVREEFEQPISVEQFNDAWRRVGDRILRKTRHVAAGEPEWIVDVYDELDCVLAEVELPSPETVVTLPAWLTSVIEREVTDEPAYTNARLALQLAETRRRSTGNA